MNKDSQWVALLDANVLYSAALRDLLMWLALNDAYRPLWTDAIHKEWMIAVLANRPEIKREKLEQTIEKMERVFPDARVENYEELIPELTLPDFNDRHVLAAAIKGNADVIISFNLKDFPDSSLASYNLKAIHPDTFVVRLFEENTSSVISTMRMHRANLVHPPKSVEEYLLTLEKQGLTQTVGCIKEFESLI